MRGQIQKRHDRSSTATDEAADELPHADHRSADEIKSDLDALLDEIDAVLDDSEELVKYRQAGGE